MDKKPSGIKKFGKSLFLTSTSLLDAFLNDTSDKKIQYAKTKEIREILQQAAQNKNLVVLQIQGKKIGEFDTLAGWIVGKNIGKEQVVLKLQNNQQQMQMIPVLSILKASSLKINQDNKVTK